MNANLKEITPVRVFEQAVDQLRTLIENGQIQVGEKLPSEKELCAALNTSRTSIREALRVLEAEGLVESRKGVGTFVSSRSFWMSSRNEIVALIRQRGEALRQILEVREYMEGLSARLAAESTTSDLILELSQMIDQLSEWVNQEEVIDMDSVAQLNLRFHLAISRASRNDIVHEILLHILPSFSESNKAILYVEQSLSRQLDEHRRVFEAIRDGNPDEAEFAMRAHVKHVRQEVMNMVSNGTAKEDRSDMGSTSLTSED